MTTSLSIPAGPAELTADWLTQALAAGGAIDRARVRGIAVAAPVGAAGLYGQTVRVVLRYDREEAGYPLSLIAKLSSAAPQMRAAAITAYAKEVHFYREMAPYTSLPTPACYYADIDPASHLHVILLEDMSPAASGSRLTGCTQQQARLAVGHIADFHAAWWEHPRLAEMTWLPDPDFGQNPSAQQAVYAGWWPRFLENIGDTRLPDPVRAIGENFGRHRAWIEHHLFNAPPRTLLHGDYHLGNLLFATEKGGAPFAVIDWQLLRRGRAVRDIAYFLSENLLPEDRRSVEPEILADYHRRLMAHGVRDYAFSDCMTDYRLALLQRFRALVSTIAVMPFTPAERQMHVDVLLPRNIAALLDHNAGDLLAGR